MPITFAPQPPDTGGTPDTGGGMTGSVPGVPASDHPDAPPYPVPGDDAAAYRAYYRFWIGVIRSCLADNTVPDRQYSYRGQALSRWSHPDLRAELTAMQTSLHQMDTGRIYVSREYE